jgi:hypothetical protein
MALEATEGSMLQTGKYEMCISTHEYYDILQDVDYNFYFKVFSGVLQQATKRFKIMETKSNDVSYCPSSPKRGRTSDSFNRETQEL